MKSLSHHHDQPTRPKQDEPRVTVRDDGKARMNEVWTEANKTMIINGGTRWKSTRGRIRDAADGECSDFSEDTGGGDLGGADIAVDLNIPHHILGDCCRAGFTLEPFKSSSLVKNTSGAPRTYRSQW